ncbi:MAG: 3'-5' exonuclease [Cyanobacteria bacterium P01_E01_bin.42]
MREDLKKVVEWSKGILATKEQYAILDTETTGLHRAEMCEIAIMDLDKNTLLNTLIKPTVPIPQDAIAIHGITNKDVENAPSFKDIYDSLFGIFQDRIILIYNVAFDTQIIKNCCKVHGLAPLPLQAFCLMEPYAVYNGDWSVYHQSYTWVPLRGGNHRAMGDCKAALKYLETMAQG